MSKENDEMPFDKDGKIDYHRWMQINAFIKKLHDMHYLEQERIREEKLHDWITRRNEMLLDLDMIDKVVDMMDEYPEAELLLHRIKRRLDNDKKY
jgi:predicted protein tyrosine phosphatase